MEYISIFWEINMKENFKIKKNLAWVNIHSQTEDNMSEIL